MDVGTGSGCLAVTVALEDGNVEAIATDVSAAALEVARENARRLGVRDRITFRHAPLTADLECGADLIVSNPPYVGEDERLSLPPDVRDWEPAGALFAGADGLDVIRVLLPAAARALRPGGWLVLEIGSGQEDAVRDLLGASGLRWQRTSRDLSGHPRVVTATAYTSAT
jgi:release factor glutamine methyltransferase